MKYPLKEMKIKALMIKQALLRFCDRVEIVGSIRRECHEVHDIDIILIPKPDMMDDIKTLCLSVWVDPNLALLSGGEKKPKWGERMASFWYRGEAPVDLYFADEHSWPTLLLIRTGSKEHNVMLCSRAKAMDMWLSADGAGLFADRLKEKQIPVSCEDDIFNALGLPVIPPAMRS